MTPDTIEAYIEAQMTKHFPDVEQCMRGYMAGYSAQRQADAVALVAHNLRAHWRKEFEIAHRRPR